MESDPDFVQEPPDAVLIGRLTRDYLLPYSRAPKLDFLGGNLAYAAAGLLLWGGRIGMAAKISKDYPKEWLQAFEKAGCDLGGIKTIEEESEERFFVAYDSQQKAHYENPLPFFAERQLSFPLELLNYSPRAERTCSRFEYKPYSFHVNDLPKRYLELNSAHICPIDFISHKILPSLLKGGLVQTLTMRAASCYMDLSFWEEIRSLVSDLTAFSFTEEQGLRLFQGRSLDLWEIMDAIAAYGPECVMVNMKDGSTRILEKISQKRWIIPEYPVKTVDPTGCMHAYDGGFLLNYRQNYDVLEAALHAVISMGFAKEGSGPLYLLDALSGLQTARLDALRPRVMAA